MTNFRNTRLWLNTLGPQNDSDPQADHREKLRNAYLKFRERAGLLAAEIARDLPDLTVHDLTHLDALWEMADLVAGPNVNLTPTEAYVLGGAFLIHDLGMGLVAYPDGIDELTNNPKWEDIVASLLKQRLGRAPFANELCNPGSDVKQIAKDLLLRDLHAEHAERLALISWNDRIKGVQYYLIDDPELRQTYGSIIGLIAYSHWWDVSRLDENFPIVFGAPAGYNMDWTVDPLKIACLFRIADATHLDARRAPGFLRAIRRPSSSAIEHWIFQEALNQPILEENRLVYTSSRPFLYTEASSWWLCFDSLQMLDRELHEVDALLADNDRPRLAAYAVAGVDDPERLKRYIPTKDWVPVDTQIRISNVAELINKIGGQQLYGQDPTIPLRELLQNASDSIRARRLLEGRSADWGDVIVRLGKDSEGYWLEVDDNGVGMSTHVLTKSLLDVGRSLWESTEMLREFPGLASKGFQATGKYGIGFFAVFMWGDHVRIISRRYDAAHRDTQVLEFERGLTSRPLLREAHESELRIEGGTCVRVWMHKPPDDPGGLLAIKTSFKRQRDSWTLDEVCEWLCPSVDFNVYVEHGAQGLKKIISASDWVSIEPQLLIMRILGIKNIPKDKKKFGLIDDLSSNLDLLRSSNGEVVGRAFICPFYTGFGHNGLITVGGFRAVSLGEVAGIFVGVPVTARRDRAIPVVDSKELSKWVSRQADMVKRVIKSQEDLHECAKVMNIFGGPLGNLPVALGSRGWLSTQEIEQRRDWPDEVLLVSDDFFKLESGRYKELILYDNVLVVEMAGGIIVQPRSGEFDVSLNWPNIESDDGGKSWHETRITLLCDVVVESLANSWGTSLSEVLKISDFESDEETFMREIGIGDGKPIITDVDVIRRPKTNN